MFLELLIVSICTTGKPGCSESTSAYYKQSVELQRIVDNAEKYGQRIVEGNEWLVYVATPAYTIVTQQTAKILLYKGVTLGYNLKDSAVFIQWNY